MARGSATTTHSTPSAESVVDSVISRGARIRGRVHGDSSLRVEGNVEGDIQVSGDLEIDEGAAVTGDIEASSLIVGGDLTGDMTLQGAITIRATAHVAGDVTGTEVILDEGAAFTGRIEVDFDLPAELSARPAGRGQSPHRESAGR